MKNIPSIKFEGKIIVAKSPKMKLWRKFLEFYDKSEDELKEMTLSEYTDAHIELISLTFSEIPAEKLEDVLEVGEIKNLTAEIFRWLQKIFFTGTENLPNAETGTE